MFGVEGNHREIVLSNVSLCVRVFERELGHPPFFTRRVDGSHPNNSPA